MLAFQGPAPLSATEQLDSAANPAAGQSSGGGKQRATESPVQSKKETAETQQQRQAAAKLALRKQLEKTLLQVGIHHI